MSYYLKNPSGDLNISHQCISRCESHHALWQLCGVSTQRNSLTFFQNVRNPHLCCSPGGGFFKLFMGVWPPIHVCSNKDSTMAARWIQVLIRETSDLPDFVAPLPSLLLIVTCLIFLFTGEWVLAIHSAEEWSSAHIHNLTNMNDALHRGMRLKSPFHKAKNPW